MGGGIFNLITSGMYNNPLALFREYIQNSADAFSATKNMAKNRLEVTIDPIHMRVKIRDNGPGLSPEEATRNLLPIGLSQKRPGADRGFRGIGRLCGLAFGESVTFLTRSRKDQPITRIVWHSSRVRDRLGWNCELAQLIQESVEIETFRSLEYPSHFFEVEVSGIGRHAAGTILNREAVQWYIGEVCPVPISNAFPFKTKVNMLFEGTGPPIILNIFVKDAPEPIQRHYGEEIRYSDVKQDGFAECEDIHLSSLDGKVSAVGWIAHSSYLGMIPRDAGIRGIRARNGNIQIGEETVFEHLFPEERFNRWCVGEIHIVDPQIVPNGRRDYFELGPHLRNLENQLIALFRKIVVRCRKASISRNTEKRICSNLAHLEETYDLAASGYLAPRDANDIVAEALTRIQQIIDRVHTLDRNCRSYLEKVEATEMKLNNFKAGPGCLSSLNVPTSEVETYQWLFMALAATSNSPHATKETIEALLKLMQRRRLQTQFKIW